MGEIQSIINQKAFLAAMKDQINTAMIQAAEPIIQDALAQVEIKMRAALAEHILARIERSIDVKTMSDRIVFEIRRGGI